MVLYTLNVSYLKAPNHAASSLVHPPVHVICMQIINQGELVTKCVVFSSEKKEEAAK